MDNKERIKGRAEGKLARAKGAHARRLRRKLGLDVGETPAPVETPAPAKKKRAKKATKKD